MYRSLPCCWLQNPEPKHTKDSIKHEGRQIITNPAKRGTYGFNKTTLSERKGAKGVVSEQKAGLAALPIVTAALEQGDAFKYVPAQPAQHGSEQRCCLTALACQAGSDATCCSLCSSGLSAVRTILRQQTFSSAAAAVAQCSDHQTAAQPELHSTAFGSLLAAVPGPQRTCPGSSIHSPTATEPALISMSGSCQLAHSLVRR